MKDHDVVTIRVSQSILNDMQYLSDHADEANGTSEYQVVLVSLALVARHFLREFQPVAAEARAPEEQ